MIKIKPLIVSLLISLGGGVIVGFLTRNSMSVYDEIVLPKFAPPSILFPIAWAILYTLMGISAYMIYESRSPLKDKALAVYFVQLAINFLWPFAFFGGRMCYLAVVILIILWVLVVWMIKFFYDIKPAAAYLNIPYILWLTFAAYLNLSIALLN